MAASLSDYFDVSATIRKYRCTFLNGAKRVTKGMNMFNGRVAIGRM